MSGTNANRVWSGGPGQGRLALAEQIVMLAAHAGVHVARGVPAGRAGAKALDESSACRAAWRRPDLMRRTR